MKNDPEFLSIDYKIKRGKKIFSEHTQFLLDIEQTRSFEDSLYIILEASYLVITPPKVESEGSSHQP